MILWAHPPSTKTIESAASRLRERIGSLQTACVTAISHSKRAGATGHATRCNPTAERIENIPKRNLTGKEASMFFTFREDARWNAERQTVEFGVEIGEYRGVVGVPRRVFQRLLPNTPTPERCVEAYYLQRTRFERIVERKIRQHQLTDDGNVEISGRDLR